MHILEKGELTASIHHIARFLKSGIPIYSSEVPDTAGRKLRKRRRANVIAKRFACHANAQNLAIHICELFLTLYYNIKNLPDSFSYNNFSSTSEIFFKKLLQGATIRIY